MTSAAEIDRVEWAGLSVEIRGDDLSRAGDTAILYLHGWGVPGAELLRVSRALARPGVRFFAPWGPLEARAGERAWWPIEPPERPAPARHDQHVAAEPHHRVRAARAAIGAILDIIRSRHRPERIVVVGSSQGGMLALDVALGLEADIERVACLSGVLLVDSVRGLLAPAAQHPPVFASHGLTDHVIPFRLAERSKSLLERHGCAVTFRPFAGGHEVPEEVLAELDRFVHPQARAHDR